MSVERNVVSTVNQGRTYSMAPPLSGSALKGPRPAAVRGRMSEEGAQELILLVNDLPDQLDLMSTLLRKSGYHVVTAEDGREGYEVALAARPDLIISDVSMPHMDGIEMCRLISEHPELRATPILLVSAVRKDSESAVAG